MWCWKGYCTRIHATESLHGWMDIEGVCMTLCCFWRKRITFVIIPCQWLILAWLFVNIYISIYSRADDIDGVYLQGLSFWDALESFLFSLLGHSLHWQRLISRLPAQSESGDMNRLQISFSCLTLRSEELGYRPGYSLRRKSWWFWYRACDPGQSPGFNVVLVR